MDRPVWAQPLSSPIDCSPFESGAWHFFSGLVRPLAPPVEIVSVEPTDRELLTMLAVSLLILGLVLLAC